MNQPNYMCDMCGKIFLREGSLRTHKKYHLNIRTKKCPHCDMTFVESKNLNRHLRSHVRTAKVIKMINRLIFDNLIVFTERRKTLSMFDL